MKLTRVLTNISDSLRSISESLSIIASFIIENRETRHQTKSAMFVDLAVNRTDPDGFVTANDRRKTTND